MTRVTGVTQKRPFLRYGRVLEAELDLWGIDLPFAPEVQLRFRQFDNALSPSLIMLAPLHLGAIYKKTAAVQSAGSI